ncbi:MAG: SpoIIE family protein phosphatase [Prevotella sp.]|nr:SpoIIE family protein phosphatase [Prevotella sp.]
MRRIAKVIILLLLLLPGMAPTARAQADMDGDSEVEQLTKEMYNAFAKSDVKHFNDVAERLKAAALKAGDERTFYKAWGNQALHSFRHVSRNKGLEIGLQIHAYAEQHDSKFGLYSSTYAIASMQNSMKMNDVAEKSFLECISYLERFFPDESTAPAYLQLAKIYHNEHRQDKEEECADKVLADPMTTAQNRLTAWSFKCFCHTHDDGSHREEFNRCWAEREKAKAEVGHDDTYGELLNMDHALVNGDYEEALRYASQMKSTLNRLNNQSHIYALMGRYQEAYRYHKEYTRVNDSLNNNDARRLTTEYSVQLDLSRAENEAKDLRLANQQQEMALMESMLQQQQLEAEAADLKLKNQDAELTNATMLLEKATLDGMTRELEFREKLSKIEAEQHAKRANKIAENYLYAIIVIVLVALGYIFLRRRHQIKQLKQKNEELRSAYDRLEETTTVKERIESELRIAHDIQMTMVPDAFPQRPDLDLYALIRPAKDVGGDLYNYVLQGDILYFCIGDVSGKGVPASLFMAQTTRLFRALASQQLMPSDIANKMNDELSENNEQGMFVTMFIGMANLKTGRLDFCNCGHNPPVLERRFLDMEPNAPLGLWPGLEFTGEHIDDIRRKRLFLYTDGLNEAEDSWQNQFGDRAMLGLLTGHQAYNCQQTVEMFENAVTEHAAGADPSDDLTMMCIKII